MSTYVQRQLEGEVRRAAKAFPAVVVTGPRRAGKTRMLRELFPRAAYHLLEDPETVARFRSDPRRFVDEIEGPAILDEVQNVPEVFSWVRARIDSQPTRKGRWFLTGSQEAPRMRGVAESMAGRAAVFKLLPFAAGESAKVSPLRGGYPEALARPGTAGLWFSSYLQTYLERDVRSVTAVRDLATFRRFLALLASRHGQLLNRSAMAAPLGVSVPTLSQWLGVLEVTAQVLIVPPYFDNLGKRLVKSPKVYFADSGLACHLLGIRSAAELARSPFRGAIFEGFIASEIVKEQVHAGGRAEVYHFRDEQGLEVDLLAPTSRGTMRWIECKSSRTVRPEDARPLAKITTAWKERHPGERTPSCVVVHEGSPSAPKSAAILPGVEAIPWPKLFGRG